MTNNKYVKVCPKCGNEDQLIKYFCGKCGRKYQSRISEEDIDKKIMESKKINSLPTEVRTEEKQQKTIVKSYSGSQELASKWFQRDAIKLSEQGYTPVTQSWSAGSYGGGMFILALILCSIFGIGIIMFIYMLLIKPHGLLSVTYGLRENSGEEKVCEMCAERVKIAAKVCRYCGHNFV